MMMRFLRIAGVAVAAALVVVSLDAQAPENPSQDTFRSSVDLVSIQTSVRDSRGRAVQGLVTTDFEVRDNGELRQVLSLHVDRSSPLSLAILVDMSGSMGVGPKRAMARQAFDSMLRQLRQGEDEIALFTFDSSLHERHDFTRDIASLRNALDEFDPFGTTSLYDATAATARRLAGRTATHKAIVVLTDGIDTSSMLTPSEVSGLASSIDAPIYVVATVPMLDQRIIMEATERGARSDAADLRDLVEWTGGRFAFASSSIETTTAAESLVEDLRLRYIIAIEASSKNEWRRLDVRVKNPSAMVKARSGYFGG